MITGTSRTEQRLGRGGQGRLLTCLTMVLLGSATSAGAATFMVNSTRDRGDSSPGDGVCRAFDGSCTLRAAIQEANALAGADSIQVPAGIYSITIPPLGLELPLLNDLSESGDFDITGPVTITGAGPSLTIIDAGQPPAGTSPEIRGLDRIFEIHRNAAAVTLSGLAVRDGYSAESGGCIQFGEGVGVDLLGLPLNPSTGTMRLENVHVLGCYASTFGGGVNNAGRGRLEIIGSTFSRNSAGEGGSAINNSGSGTVEILSGTVITNNPGTFMPDPLDPGTLVLTDPMAYPIGSGAIHNQAEDNAIGTIRVADSTISGNAAEGPGAGIGNAGSGHLIVERTTFSGNATEDSGGGIYLASGTATVSHCTFENNKAANGGGIYNGGEVSEISLPGQLNVSHSTFSGHDVESGGGIYNNQEGVLVVSDSSFTGNFAHDYGGGLAATERSKVTLTRIHVGGNKASGEGGGAYLASEKSIVVVDSVFENNIAGEPSVEIDGTIELNDASGGGLYGEGAGTTEITGSSFLGNSATEEGGGIYLDNEGSVAISDSVVQGNFSALGGGGIQNAATRVVFTRLTVTGNESLADGGGIESQGSGDFTIQDTNIFNNKAENGGGIANAADGRLLIKRTAVFNNRAQFGPNDDHGLGGGIYVLGDAGIIIENTIISGNFAPVRGGGLYVDADAHTHVINSTIAGNAAPIGSAVADEGTNFNFPIMPSKSVLFRNTIVARNRLGESCNYALGSEGGNIEDGDSCYFRGPRDRTNTDPRIDAIADNGGFVLTHALREDSVAIDGGSAIAPCILGDSRGVARPLNVACDSGAFEFEGPFPPPDDMPPETMFVSMQRDDEIYHSFRFDGMDDSTPTHLLLYECRILEADFTEPPEPIDPTQPLDPELMFVGCPNPWQVPDLEEGQFTLEVRAIDRAGNVDDTPAVFEFTLGIDSAPPQTIFTSTPPNPSEGRFAVFTFSGIDDQTPAQFLEFECRLDSNDPELWLECTNPFVAPNLTTGEHTFEVRALDLAEAMDPSPARYTWTVGPPSNCDIANVTLVANADVTLDEETPDENLVLNPELSVRSQDLGRNARVLIRFPLQNDAPACALESATLRLYAEDVTIDRTLEAHVIAEPWAVNQATWIFQPATTGTPAVTRSGDAYREWDVTSHVEAIFAGTLPNHGWLIRDAVENDPEGGDQGFISHETPQDPPPVTLPQLVLRYASSGPTPVPTPQSAPVPSFVFCGQEITESTLVLNDLTDCLGEGLVIGAPDIILDLGGHTIMSGIPIELGEEEGLMAGIRNAGHANVVIRNGRVKNFGYGVRLMGDAIFNIVEEMSFEGNVVAGVELYAATDGRNGSTIRNNYFTANGENAIALISGSEGSLIIGNTFESNGGVAVLIQDASRHRIENNNINGTSFDPLIDSDGGIYLEGGRDNVIIGNTISDMGDACVFMHAGSHGNRVEGNVMTRCGDAGVIAQDSDRAEVLNNTAHLSSDAGVVLSNSHDSMVVGNDVRFNPGGVAVSGSTGALVESNNASFTDQEGIQIGSGSGGFRVLSNIASNTGATGISIEAGEFDLNGLPVHPGRVEGNTANENLAEGISVAAGGHIIAHNGAYNNAGTGIHSDGSLDGVFNLDGGGNAANGNFSPEQCVGVICDTSMTFPILPLDFTPPETIISGPPGDPSDFVTVRFEFTGTDNQSAPTALRFECRLDPRPDPIIVPEPPDLPDPGDIPDPPEPIDPTDPESWIECSSPVLYKFLELGEHTFQVRAIDYADNVDYTHAEYVWTVANLSGVEEEDTLPPHTTIAEGPINPTTSDTATFEFRGSDNITPGLNLHFECRLDSSNEADFVDCTSPLTYTDVTGGPHQFEVRAVDAAGLADPTPAAYAWSREGVSDPHAGDVTPPETTISTGPHVATVLTGATFEFSASEAEATFECSLDGEVFAPCTSPLSFTGLMVGQHVLLVKATDPAGNTDPTPADYPWQIGPPPVPTTVSCGQVLTQSTLVLNDLSECLGNGLVVGADAITIDLNNRILDGTSQGIGVLVDGFTAVTLQNGTLREFDAGIQLRAQATSTLVQNVSVELNGVAGILLTDAGDGVHGNLIINNTVVNNDRGIVLDDGTRGTLVRGNTVGNNSGEGIMLQVSNSNRIESNLVSGSSGAGVGLGGSRGNIVRGNTLANNDEGGVVVGLSEGLIITPIEPPIVLDPTNPIEPPEPVDPIDPVDPIIETVGIPSDSNRIEGNTIDGSGLFVIGSAGNELIHNSVTDSGGAGIVLELTQLTLVQGNDVRNNSGGIELKSATGSRIESNVLVENGGAGISLEALSLSNVLVLNDISVSSGHGIYIGDPALGGMGNLLDRNRTNENGGNGIHLGNLGHIVVDNVANDNQGWGIYSVLGTLSQRNIDGGGNFAVGNLGGTLDPITLQLAQCFNIVCDGSAAGNTDPVPPDTLILAHPSSLTTDGSARFRFTGTDNFGVARFQCRIDSLNEADFALCTSPVEYSGLAVGGHTFEVRAVDASSNADATPASFTWTIAEQPTGVPPQTAIDSGPDLATVSTDALFVFSSNEPGTTFECSLDGAPFAACSSPQNYSALAAGAHAFSVRATDAESLVDASPAEYLWMITPAPIPATVSCGAVITESILVMNDLFDCPGIGLVVGANGITIDLNGHVIDGVGSAAGIVNPQFDSATVTNGTVREFDFGVQLNPGSRQNIVSLLTLQANQEAAIMLSDADEGIVRHNTITANNGGIWLTGGTRGARVHENHITQNTGDALFLEFSSDNRIEANQLTANNGSGVHMTLAHNNRVVGNTLADNIGGGIIAGDGLELPANGNHIEGNTITAGPAAGGPGIVIAGGLDNTVQENIISGLSGTGITIEEARSTLVRGNQVRFGSGGGIAVSDSTDNIIEMNDTSASMGTGISVDGISTNNLVVLNIASGNAGDGISVSDLAPFGLGNVVDRNTASSNGGDGIAVHGAGHTVIANVGDFNGGWGIYALLGTTDGGGNRALGNVEPEQCFTIQCEIGAAPGAPDTMLIEAPPSVSPSRFATFMFTGSSVNTALIDLSFECRLDSQDPLAFTEGECENPQFYGGLAPGMHTFEVRAVDLLGLVDPTPARHDWSVVPLPSGEAPDTVINMAPPSLTYLFEAIFTFSATEPDVAFECRIDAGPWEPCSFEYDIPLASGAYEAQFEEFQVGLHTFEVRAIDFEGNADPTPASHTWSILGVITTITNGPAFLPPEAPGEPASGGEIESSTATFEFEANVADATFLCSLDMAPFLPCSSPQTYTGLSIGEHLLRIIATDPEGNTEVEPMEYEWAVVSLFDEVPPETTLLASPANNSSDTVFSFTGSDNLTPLMLLAFECRLDSTNALDWVECFSPFNLYEMLPPEEFLPGTHTFEVRAVDNAEPLDPTALQEGNPDPTPASHTWTSVVDTTPPETSILIAPILTTVEGDVTFEFAGSDNATPSGGVRSNLQAPEPLSLLVFECSVDGAPFEPCDSPESEQGLLPGPHTFQVRAVDLALNADPTPAAYTWTFVGPPETTIVSGPPALSTTAVATFIFASDQSNVVFHCALDGADFTPCASPLTFTHLPNTEHELEVQAINTFLLVDETPAIYEWTVNGPLDVEAPDTSITTSPADVTTSSEVTFTFSSNEPFTTFECALDGGAYSSCESPYLVSDLTAGQHSFTVRAVDFVGNVDATPAEDVWIVDLAPVTIVLVGPPDATSSTTATFFFDADEPATFQCWLDGVVSPCTSPVEYTGLALGEHLFAVLGTDLAGNVAVEWVEHEWIIDLAPDTTIFVAPADNSTEFTFVFGGTDNLTAPTNLSFECRMDNVNGGVFAGCENPLSLLEFADPTQLAGVRTFEVRAVDENALPDPSPASYTWTYGLDIIPPDTSIDIGPLAASADPVALFAFSAGEPDVVYSCSLDGAAFEGCTSPEEYSGLALGLHTFQVFAVDAAGNVEATPAGYVWTVLAAPPETSIDFGPSSATTDTSATFNFSASEPGSTFECSLDGEAFTACFSPIQLGGLAVGAHTFDVRATGLADTTDPTPARYIWTVEALPPPNCGVPITLFADADSWIEQNSPFNNKGTDSTLKLQSKGPSDNVRALVHFAIPAPPDRCMVETATLRMFAPSASPGRTLHALRLSAPWVEQDVNWSNQPATIGSPAATGSVLGFVEWNVTAQVQAMNGAGAINGFLVRDASENGGGFEQQFHAREKSDSIPTLVVRFIAAPPVDTTAPLTVVDARPDAVTAALDATFAFSANDPAATFECALDGLSFVSCSSPIAFTGLPLGEHLFRVRATDAVGNVDPTPASVAWRIVAVEELFETVILLGPPALTGSPDALFEFTGVDNTTPVLEMRYECALDGQPFEECTTPHLVEGLAVGQHTLLVRAVDLEQNVDPTPASYSWTIDTADHISPDTAIIVGPPQVTGMLEMGFAFLGSDNVTPELALSFECSLNGEPFAECSSPHTVEGPEPGQPAEPGMAILGLNRFEVRAIDLEGNVDGSPAVYTWTLVGPPDTFLHAAPANPSASDTATFTFSSDQPEATFLCTIELFVMVPCTSPFVVNGLLDGETYEFEVMAVNNALGAIDEEPAVHEWTVMMPVDLLPPETTIILGPSSLTASEEVIIAFTGSDNRTPPDELEFQCSLDGVFLGSCSSPYSLEVPGIGVHTFEVAAVDLLGMVDPSPAVRTWRLIDVTPPDTSIDTGPESFEAGETVPPGVDPTVATFTFSGFEELTGEPVFDFECSLDGADFAPCTNPHEITGLGQGGHALLVRAVDPSGNGDPTPDVWEWILELGLDETPPDTYILGVVVTPPPPGTSDSALTTISFTASEAGAEFECALDGGAFEGCDPPYEVEGLAAGVHVINIRAIDEAGNVDPDPATAMWTIGGAPETTILTGPPSPDPSGTATFTFSSNLSGVTFVCTLDGSEPLGCTSPHVIPALIEGEHVFEVQAISAQNGVDPTPASYTWSIGMPPDTTIVSVTMLGPLDLNEPDSLRFEFTGTDDRTLLIDLEFECSLNGAAFNGCDSPHYVDLLDLAAGSHLFEVRARDIVGNVDPTPDSYGWTLAPVPDTTIDSGPVTPTESTEATFTFSADQPGASFQCSLDLAPFTICESPLSFSGLGFGAHELQVRARAANGNVDLEPAVYEWEIGDLTPPVATIHTGPPAAGDGTSATFTFTADEPGVSFLCSLDGGPQVFCLSPHEYTGLAVGDHTLEVVATKPNLLEEPVAAVYEWTVIDITPPETTISFGPIASTTDTLATFLFTGSDNGTLAVDLDFECALDAAPFEPCASPMEVADLTLGAHTLLVRAVDESLLVDPSPAAHSWTVVPDSTPPETSIAAGPPAVTFEIDAEFAFFGVDDTTPVEELVFECSLDGAAFGPCGSPEQISGLGGGSHTFEVRAVDLAGNFDPTPAAYDWIVGLTPETTIDSGPSLLSASADATFTFSADLAGGTFECSLDAGAFTTCASPHTLTELSAGPHAFAVRAIGSTGFADPTPAEYDWTVEAAADTTPPETSIDTGPALATANTNATFTFSSNEVGATFECSIDAAPFAECSSPQTFSGLTGGPHLLEVRAIDLAENADPTPATYAWSVELPPETLIDSGPTDPTTSTIATFVFSSTKPGSTFQCSIDLGPLVACTSPATYTGMAVGPHEFLVRAIDALGSADPTPEDYEWEVVPPDTTPPQTTLTGQPTATTTSTSATFSFGANEPDSTFACSLDTGAFATCFTPVSYSGLGVGSHTFRVRAVDLSGNVDPTPATYTWTVQSLPDCSGQLVLSADADAWIEQNSPGNNKGSDSILKVTGKSSNNNTRALVRFPLPAPPNGCVVQSATLRLYAPSWQNGRTLQALRLVGAWAENVVTWANQPTTSGTAATTSSGSGYRSWNVTAQVQTMYSTGANHGFLVRDATESGGGAEQQLHSREKGETPPTLVIQFAPAGP